jgi:hypothetical protein
MLTNNTSHLYTRVRVRLGCQVDTKLPFPKQFGIVAIRGCEIEGILNEKGQLADGPQAEGDRSFGRGDDRTYRVWLDCNQYQTDLAAANAGSGDVYVIHIRSCPWLLHHCDHRLAVRVSSEQRLILNCDPLNSSTRSCPLARRFPTL